MGHKVRNKEIATKDLSSLKFIPIAGGQISPYVWSEFSRLLPNCELSFSYGSTELGTVARNYPYTGVNAVGQLHCDVKVKILDKNGNRLGVGEICEICVQKTFKFLGYFESPEKILGMFDDEGFLMTDDAGYFDEDGYLHVIDRMDNSLKHCENPILQELKELLLSHPKVRLSYVAKVADDVLVTIVICN